MTVFDRLLWCRLSFARMGQHPSSSSASPSSSSSSRVVVSDEVIINEFFKVLRARYGHYASDQQLTTLIHEHTRHGGNIKHLINQSIVAPPIPGSVSSSSSSSAVTDASYRAPFILHALSPKYALPTKGSYRHVNNLCRILLQHGSNPNLSDDDGRTPLDIACESYGIAFITELLSSYSCVVTPSSFAIAVQRGRVDVCQLLIQHKVIPLFVLFIYFSSSSLSYFN
jgi:hypothetical protein